MRFNPAAFEYPLSVFYGIVLLSQDADIVVNSDLIIWRLCGKSFHFFCGHNLQLTVQRSMITFNNMY